MYNLYVNFDKTVGKVKPFHGINNAPIKGPEDLMHYLGDAGIPYSRLHDTGGRYGGFRYVDIENIFRDFSADPENPDSYDFAFTDKLLAEITEQGTEPFYRLGATIENSHRIKAYHIFPPKDNLKWAKICEGIIKHYNHGFANGFHYGIKYWEIWNEPDNERNIEDNPMWKGTKEQYYSLYEVTANYLKSVFDDIKVGGYAGCGMYAIEDGYDSPGIPSHRAEYFLEFFEGFLKYITSDEHKAPLDFFSWHSYEDSKRSILYTRFVREKLNEYGFDKAESILNEWNPGTQYRGSEEDAARILTMITYLHREPLDKLMYYDGQEDGIYNGIFNPLQYNSVFPAYYAFEGFNRLYKLGSEAELKCDSEYLPALAATDGKTGLILIANEEDKPLEYKLETTGDYTMKKVLISDGENGFKESDIKCPDMIFVPAKKMMIIEFEK